MTHISLSKLAVPTKLLLAAALTASLVAFALPASQPAAITVHGTVTAGERVMPGMTVEIHAWPDQAVIQALKPGQKVPWVLVGTATTGVDGTYSVSLPLAKLMPEASYGVVNLEADTKTGLFGFPVVVAKNSGNAYLAGSDLVANVPASGTGCGGAWNYIASLGKHWETVGQTYVPTSHATQHFTYKAGQSSSLGWGISASGAPGTFTEQGTYSWSSSFRETWPTFGANRSVWYRTEFHWGEYECIGYHIIPFDGQHVNGYAGGARVMTPSFVPNTPQRFCVFQMAGSSPQSNNSAAVTWTRKLALQAVEDDAGLGFDASAETGYDSSALLTYKVSVGRNLCGWKGDPGGSPKQLVIRP